MYGLGGAASDNQKKKRLWILGGPAPVTGGAATRTTERLWGFRKMVLQMEVKLARTACRERGDGVHAEAGVASYNLPGQRRVLPASNS